MATATDVAPLIKVGDMAPDFTLKDQDQKDVTLSSFRGRKNVVLAFYPLDWSPVCTGENKCLTDDFPKFEGLNTVVLGISTDSFFSHKAWADALGLKKTNLVALIDAFEDRGLARRRPTENDRRAHALHLTPRGIALIGRLHRIDATLDRSISALVSPDAGRGRFIGNRCSGRICGPTISCGPRACPSQPTPNIRLGRAVSRN